MSNSDERRWQQRLDNFGTAIAQLTSACERERYDHLERAGLIKERYHPVLLRLHRTPDAKRGS
ncbi:MAG: hypothetical protein OXH96_14845 [Spirochaetaceae bacterium]|nr:hypothetical protein [Spirochaetaceae bacterium]